MKIPFHTTITVTLRNKFYTRSMIPAYSLKSKLMLSLVNLAKDYSLEMTMKLGQHIDRVNGDCFAFILL